MYVCIYISKHVHTHIYIVRRQRAIVQGPQRCRRIVILKDRKASTLKITQCLLVATLSLSCRMNASIEMFVSSHIEFANVCLNIETAMFAYLYIETAMFVSLHTV